MKRLVLRAIFLALVGLALSYVSLARAQRVSLRGYSQADGLSNLDVGCLQQDATGILFVCTSDGVFVYEGRRFLNLGPEQGLPDGGSVADIAFTSDDRVIIRFNTAIFVSDRSINKFRPPDALHFTFVASPAKDFIQHVPVQMTPWQGSAAVLLNGQLVFVDVSNPSLPRLQPIKVPVAVKNPRNGPITLASVGNRLWVSYADGNVCGFDDR